MADQPVNKKFGVVFAVALLLIIIVPLASAAIWLTVTIWENMP